MTAVSVARLRAGSRCALFVVALCSALSFSPLAPAQIYRWVDANGNVHYSDEKPPSDASQAEDISATIDTARSEPDEGELRRRDYLKTAELLPDRVAERARQRSEAEAVDRRALCQQARVHSEVLKLNLRVYRTENGELRPHWFPDAYQGERTYLSDAERPAVIAAMAQQRQANCVDPMDSAAQLRAYNRWLVADWCDTSKGDLDSALEERARSTGDKIDRLRREVNYWCGPGA